MEQNLQFKIGSTFSGEGFTKLAKSVKDVNQTVTRSSAAISAVSTSIGAMDSKAAKAVAAVTNLVNSFMTLNPVMVTITAATAAVSWGIKELKEREEAAQKKADDLRTSMEKLVTKLNDRIFDKAVSDAADLGKEFERITKHANDMTSALNALATEKAKGGALDIQVEKLNAVVNEITDEGKKVVAAEYDVRIAYQNLANTTEAENAKVAAAHQAIVDEENRVVNLQQQRAEMETQLQRLEQNNHALKLAEKSVREKLLKQIEDMKAKMEAVDDKILASKEKIEVLRVNEQTAIERQNNAIESATMEVTRTENAQKELTESLDEAKEAERLRLDSIRENAEQEDRIRAQEEEAANAIADAKKEYAEATKAASEATSDVKKAEKNLAEAVEKYQNNLANFNQNNIYKAIEQTIGGGKNQFASNFNQLLAKSGEIADAARENAVSQGIANGSIRTVDQAIKTGNEAARQARVQLNSKQTKQELADKQRFDKLSGLSEKALSQNDKNFLRQYNQIKEANQKAASAVEARKVELQMAQHRELQRTKDIAAIRKKMDKLGIK